MTNGTLDAGATSPMDRLDNLIINGERNGTASRTPSSRTGSSRERTPPVNNTTSVSLMGQLMFLFVIEIYPGILCSPAEETYYWWGSNLQSPFFTV